MDDLSPNIQNAATQLAGQAKDMVSDQVEKQTTSIGNTLSDQAQNLRSAAQSLREQNNPAVAFIAEQVGIQVERAGSYLRATSGDELLESLESFARSQPWFVATGGLLLGIAVSRSLKASSGQRYRARYEGDYGTGAGAYSSGSGRTEL